MVGFQAKLQNTPSPDRLAIMEVAWGLLSIFVQSVSGATAAFSRKTVSQSFHPSPPCFRASLMSNRACVNMSLMAWSGVRIAHEAVGPRQDVPQPSFCGRGEPVCTAGWGASSERRSEMLSDNISFMSMYLPLLIYSTSHAGSGG